MAPLRLFARVSKGQTRAEAELAEKKETGSCRSQIKERRSCKVEAKEVQVSEVYYDVSLLTVTLSCTLEVGARRMGLARGVRSARGREVCAARSVEARAPRARTPEAGSRRRADRLE